MGLQTPLAPPGPRARSFYPAAALALAVWSVTPVAWLILLRALHRYLVQGKAFVPSGGFKRFWFFYSCLEVPFSVYLRYLIHKASARRAPPNVDRDTLETLLVHCLEVGTIRNASAPTSRSASPPGSGSTSVVERLPRTRAKDGLRNRTVTPESAQLAREKLLVWFHGASIDELRADNVREWLAWAFEGRELAEVRKSRQMVDLIDDALALTERRMLYTFPPGYNHKINAIRLTLDPLLTSHRPLGHYVVINGVTAAIIAYLRAFKGFRYVRCGKCEFLVKDKVAGADSDDKDALPVLFLHGLGIGAGQYSRFLGHLANHKHGVVVLIQPNISGTITSPHFISPANQDEHARAIAHVMRSSGFNEATVVSHSNGTMLHGWILRACPDICKRNVLVDPVCFRLWEASVCYSFLHKPWSSGIEVLLGYFVARELSVAYTIMRQFSWSSMAMWVREFPSIDPSRFHVVFAEHDFLVDVPACVDYLREEGVTDECITVLPHYQHGQALIFENEGMRVVCDNAKVTRA